MNSCGAQRIHLSEKSTSQDPPSGVQPINDWIGIFWQRCSENNECVPRRHLFPSLLLRH